MILNSLATHDISVVQVNIEADQAFIFDFAVLSDHQHVLFLDQMLNCIRNLSGLLSGPLNRSAHSLIQRQRCDYLINDIALLCRLLTFRLELSEDANN